MIVVARIVFLLLAFGFMGSMSDCQPCEDPSQLFC